MVHDDISGTLAAARKEELQVKIEREQEMGEDSLLEGDTYLPEINLDSLDNTSGAIQHYWLQAIKTARKAQRLRQAE